MKASCDLSSIKLLQMTRIITYGNHHAAVMMPVAALTIKAHALKARANLLA
jgi:hypothetical protein